MAGPADSVSTFCSVPRRSTIVEPLSKDPRDDRHVSGPPSIDPIPEGEPAASHRLSETAVGVSRARPIWAASRRDPDSGLSGDARTIARQCMQIGFHAFHVTTSQCPSRDDDCLGARRPRRNSMQKRLRRHSRDVAGRTPSDRTTAPRGAPNRCGSGGRSGPPVLDMRQGLGPLARLRGHGHRRPDTERLVSSSVMHESPPRDSAHWPSRPHR